MRSSDANVVRAESLTDERTLGSCLGTTKGVYGCRRSGSRHIRACSATPDVDVCFTLVSTCYRQLTAVLRSYMPMSCMYYSE